MGVECRDREHRWFKKNTDMKGNVRRASDIQGGGRR
jgi:hypothetical protein